VNVLVPFLKSLAMFPFIKSLAMFRFKEKMFEGGGSGFREKADTKAELINHIPIRARVP